MTVSNGTLGEHMSEKGLPEEKTTVAVNPRYYKIQLYMGDTKGYQNAAG